MTLTLEIGPELEEALRATAERAGVAPDRCALDLLREHLTPANSSSAGLPRVESELLERINEGLPEADWRSYHALKQKRDAGTLDDAEYAKLLHLVNEIEIWNARRLEAAADLARLRGVPFPDLVRELGLGQPANA